MFFQKILTKGNLVVTMTIWLHEICGSKCGVAWGDWHPAVALWTCLWIMGHLQQPTLLKIDNIAVNNGIINNTLQQKRSEAMDVCFHWLQD